MTAVVPVQFFKSVNCFVGILCPFCWLHTTKVGVQTALGDSVMSWWLVNQREHSTKPNVFRSRQPIVLPIKNQKALEGPACCSAVIPQSRSTYIMLRATDPLAYYFWSCLRSHPAAYVLSENVMQNQASLLAVQCVLTHF